MLHTDPSGHLQTPQQSPHTLIPSLCEVTLICDMPVNLSPLSEQHGRLLQHFSTIFSGSQFRSFTVDGIIFQDTPSSQPFGSILHSFLTSSTTHEQRLIFQNIAVHSTSLPPPVVTPECGLHYKFLIIEMSVIPNLVINWLLKRCELHLKNLKLDIGFKKTKLRLLPTGSPLVASLPQPASLLRPAQPAALIHPLRGFTKVHVKTLALHTGTTQQVGAASEFIHVQSLTQFLSRSC